jgi:hypothetical protein
MKDTLYVNLYSGPGVGKTSMACDVFAKLKWMKYDCELVREYAKNKVWEESYNVLDDQLYVTAKQHHEMKILNGKVDIVITDSPLLLGLIYNKNEPPEYESMVIAYYRRYHNLDIFLKRVKEYNTNGRMQTEEEAIKKDEEILEIFKKYCYTVGSLPASEESVNDIIKLIQKIKGT